MNKTIRWGMGACVAALALALNSGVASAQQKAPEAPAKTEAKKVEPPKDAAKKVDAVKKAEPAKDAKAPAAKKPVPAKSACAGIDEPACGLNAECMWVKEVVTKAGQKRKAHCQKKPTPPKSKAAAPAAAPAAPKAVAPAAPKAAAPAPAAPAPAAPPPAAKK